MKKITAEMIKITSPPEIQHLMIENMNEIIEKLAINVKIKKIKNSAVIPSYAKSGDAGLDLTCTEAIYDVETRQLECRTGLAIEIPEGFVGLIFPRSSIYKTTLNLTNCVGVIDSGYRGEIIFKFRNTGDSTFYEGYKKGDRVGQMIIMPYPQIQLEEVNELSETERGSGGYGSSGS